MCFVLFLIIIKRGLSNSSSKNNTNQNVRAHTMFSRSTHCTVSLCIYLYNHMLKKTHFYCAYNAFCMATWVRFLLQFKDDKEVLNMTLSSLIINPSPPTSSHPSITMQHHRQQPKSQKHMKKRSDSPTSTAGAWRAGANPSRKAERTFIHSKSNLETAWPILTSAYYSTTRIDKLNKTLLIRKYFTKVLGHHNVQWQKFLKYWTVLRADHQSRWPGRIVAFSKILPLLLLY